MEAPLLGSLEIDPEFGWYRSRPINVPMLDGKRCVIVLEAYADDEAKEDFHAAVANLLKAGSDVLRRASTDIHQYFLDANDRNDRDEDERVLIDSPADVWDHIDLGDEIMVTRRSSGDKSVYASIECNCDWEEEHGLQIVLKNGSRVCKVGPYNGHLTNSDAYADETLEDVVYVRIGQSGPSRSGNRNR